MAKYSIRIELPGLDGNQHQQLHTELKKEKGFKLFTAKPAAPVQGVAEYDVEGNISIPDLGNLVSRISAKINKNYSFTILRSKVALGR